MISELINIYAVEPHGITTLGPGVRYGLWLQGCPFDCPGCATPQARPVEAATICHTDQVAADIISSPCGGLTISGGEPMLQAAPVARLLKTVTQARPDMTVIIFTGFRIEALLSDDARAVLSMTDLLVDGPYVEALNDGRGMRGSSNQRLHFLTGRLTPWRDTLSSGPRSIELTIARDTTRAVGIPTRLPAM